MATENLPRNLSRNWIFTWNNYEPNDIEYLQKIFENEKFLFQEECGEETKTPHLQGTVMFKNKKSLKTLKNISKKIHWEKAKNVHACLNYCCKLKTRSGEIYTNIKKEKKSGKELFWERVQKYDDEHKDDNNTPLARAFNSWYDEINN